MRHVFQQCLRKILPKMICLALSGTLWSPAALAHPLGNYSINQYTLFDLRGEEFKLYYLLDIAEIPSFREMDLLDADFDNVMSDGEIDAYLHKRIPGLSANLRLTRDGEPVPLELLSHGLEVYEGTGAMPVFNIFLEFTARGWTWPADAEGMALDFRSDNHINARGYRECYVLLDGRYSIGLGPWTEGKLKYLVLVLQDENDNPLFQSFYNRFQLELSPGSGEVFSGPSPKTDFSWTATARSDDELTTVLASRTRTVTPDAVPGQAAAAAPPPVDPSQETQPTVSRIQPTRQPQPASSETAKGLLLRVSDILRTRELTLPMVLVAMAIALGLGMGHAFSPGHGKTVMAAYLIGERGTVWHACVLGVIVTFTHVWSVLLLGIVTLYAGERFTEEAVTFWTGIASGAIIVIIGLLLFYRRFTSFVLARHSHAHTRAHSHGHDHDHHHDRDHEHEHEHDHGHGHVHRHGLFGKPHTHVVEPEEGRPPTYSSITWLGISGGIVPCPAALIVLLLAIKFGRLQLGLLLIVAFSFGLAAVLVAIGIAVVKASGGIRRLIGERSPVLLALPVVSSVLITILGLWIVLWTLMQFNVVAITRLG